MVAHDDVIKWKHFPRYLTFVWGIDRSPVDSPHKGQWREALMFSLFCAWINSWVNNRDFGDLRRHETPWRSLWRQCNVLCCFLFTFLQCQSSNLEWYGRINHMNPPRTNHIAMQAMCINEHDDVIKWKHFLRYWPFVPGIHRSPVNSPHKGRWRGTLIFSLICGWLNAWVNDRTAGDLRRHCADYSVIVMMRHGILGYILGEKIIKFASF